MFVSRRQRVDSHDAPSASLWASAFRPRSGAPKTLAMECLKLHLNIVGSHFELRLVLTFGGKAFTRRLRFSSSRPLRDSIQCWEMLSNNNIWKPEMVLDGSKTICSCSYLPGFYPSSRQRCSRQSFLASGRYIAATRHVLPFPSIYGTTGNLSAFLHKHVVATISFPIPVPIEIHSTQRS
jgi:hypothetical protein